MPFRNTPEGRAHLSAGMRRSWEERRPWLEASGPIRAAAESGDYDTASELLYSYMAARKLDEESGEEEPHGSGDNLDELFAETHRIHAERNRERGRLERPAEHVLTPGDPDAVPQAKAARPSLTGRQRQISAIWNYALPRISDADAIRIGRELIAAMSTDREPDEHDSIPTPTERAAAKRRVANKLQGEPLGNDATPYLRHPPAAEPDEDEAGR